MNTDNIRRIVVVITDASGVQTASKKEESNEMKRKVRAGVVRRL